MTYGPLVFVSACMHYHQVSCLAHADLLVKNSQVNEVKFCGLISKLSDN